MQHSLPKVTGEKQEQAKTYTPHYLLLVSYYVNYNRIAHFVNLSSSKIDNYGLLVIGFYPSTLYLLPITSRGTKR